MHGRLSKIRSVHTYVIPWTFFFVKSVCCIHKSIDHYLQQSWKQEVWEHNEKVKGEDNSIVDQTMLIKQRKQELKHAMDVKALFEKKLDKVNDLYMELNAWRLQLEEEERTLQRKKKQLNVQQNSKIYYKKKQKPLVISKAQERFQKKAALKYAVSSEGCRSTSPESPYKLPPPYASPSPFGAGPLVPGTLGIHSGPMGASGSKQLPKGAAGPATLGLPADKRPQVRINPLYSPRDSSTPPVSTGFIGTDKPSSSSTPLNVTRSRVSLFYTIAQ